MRRPSRWLPATWATLVVLLLSAWWTGSLGEGLAHTWIRNLGFAPRDLWYLSWWRLLTSALITHGGGEVWRAFFMTAWGLGACERRCGTRWALAAFWGVHLLALGLLSLLLLVPRLATGWWPVAFLPMARDVGPSAGYVGCLGAWLGSGGERWRGGVALSILAVLALAAFLPPLSPVPVESKLAADLAHLLALPLGWLVGRRWRCQNAAPPGPSSR